MRFLIGLAIVYCLVRLRWGGLIKSDTSSRCFYNLPDAVIDDNRNKKLASHRISQARQPPHLGHDPCQKELAAWRKKNQNMQTRRLKCQLISTPEQPIMDFPLDFILIFYKSLTLTWPLFIFLAALVTLMGLVVGVLESWRRFDSIYWAFITATTVGYGDFRPVRPMSRVLSILIAFTGVLFTGLWVSVAVYAGSLSLNQQEGLESILQCLQKVQ